MPGLFSLSVENLLQLLGTDIQFRREFPEHLPGWFSLAVQECKDFGLRPVVPLGHLREAGAVRSVGAASGEVQDEVFQSHREECSAFLNNLTTPRLGSSALRSGVGVRRADNTAADPHSGRKIDVRERRILRPSATGRHGLIFGQVQEFLGRSAFGPKQNVPPLISYRRPPLR